MPWRVIVMGIVMLGIAIAIMTSDPPQDRTEPATVKPLPVPGGLTEQGR